MATAQIPSNLKAGNYMVRHEIISLQNAVAQGGAEFYPSCSQLNVGGSQTGTPQQSDLVNFPGAYKDTDPGIYDPDVYNPGASYTFPGPNVASFISGSSSSSGGSSNSGSGSGSGSSSGNNNTSSSTNNGDNGNGNGSNAGSGNDGSYPNNNGTNSDSGNNGNYGNSTSSGMSFVPKCISTSLSLTDVFLPRVVFRHLQTPSQEGLWLQGLRLQQHLLLQ